MQERSKHFGFRTWLTAHACQVETVEFEGQVYRYELESDKEFLTAGGLMTASRRVYQPDCGGNCHVPLDAAWGMQEQFATHVRVCQQVVARDTRRKRTVF